MDNETKSEILNGINLHIDKSIQELCEASNASSSVTRRILYVMVVVCILSFISVINTHKWNWTKQRISHYSLQINNLLKVIKSDPNNDSLTTELSIYRDRLRTHIKNNTENFSSVHIPIAGNEFDVNNLGIVAGISFMFLLIILYFTINREIDNLKIALKAISERYSDQSDKILFNTEGNILKEINRIRRKHHYNYLSMNEVFSQPPLDLSKRKPSFIDNFQRFILYIPLATYVLVIVNDVLTAVSGWDICGSLTIVGFCANAIFLAIIWRLSYTGTQRKMLFSKLFADFLLKQYKFVDS